MVFLFNARARFCGQSAQPVVVVVIKSTGDTKGNSSINQVLESQSESAWRFDDSSAPMSSVPTAPFRSISTLWRHQDIDAPSDSMKHYVLWAMQLVEPPLRDSPVDLA